MKIQTMTRAFRYNGMALADPSRAMTPEQVRDSYTHQYPELATATIEGPEAEGSTLVFTFTRKIGMKG